MSATAGRAASSCSGCVRSVPVRATPGSWASDCTKAGAKVAVSVLLPPPLLPPPPPPLLFFSAWTSLLSSALVFFSRASYSFFHEANCRFSVLSSSTDLALLGDGGLTSTTARALCSNSSLSVRNSLGSWFTGSATTSVLSSAAATATAAGSELRCWCLTDDV